MTLNQTKDLTYNERMVLSAIEAGQKTVRRIIKHARIDPHDVGHAIEVLCNNGYIDINEWGEWYTR